MQVSKYLNPMENQVFQFSVYNFHSMKTSLTKHVLLVWMGYKTIPLAYSSKELIFSKFQVNLYYSCILQEKDNSWLTVEMVRNYPFLKWSFLLQIFRNLHDEAFFLFSLFVLICHYEEDTLGEFFFYLKRSGGRGQGVAVNWDFVLLLPPSRNPFLFTSPFIQN